AIWLHGQPTFIHRFTDIFAPCSLYFLWRSTCSLFVTGRLRIQIVRPHLGEEKTLFMVEEHIIETRNSSSWQLPAIIVLGLVAIAGLGFGWNASSKLDSTQQAVNTEVKSAQQSVQQDMSSLKDRIAQDEKAN